MSTNAWRSASTSRPQARPRDRGTRATSGHGLLAGTSLRARDRGSAESTASRDALVYTRATASGADCRSRGQPRRASAGRAGAERRPPPARLERDPTGSLAPLRAGRAAIAAAASAPQGGEYPENADRTRLTSSSATVDVPRLRTTTGRRGSSSPGPARRSDEVNSRIAADLDGWTGSSTSARDEHVEAFAIRDPARHARARRSSETADASSAPAVVHGARAPGASLPRPGALLDGDAHQSRRLVRSRSGAAAEQVDPTASRGDVPNAPSHHRGRRASTPLPRWLQLTSTRSGRARIPRVGSAGSRASTRPTVPIELAPPRIAAAAPPARRRPRTARGAARRS